MDHLIQLINFPLGKFDGFNDLREFEAECFTFSPDGLLCQCLDGFGFRPAIPTL